jgi:hypothetical protein
MYDHPIKRAGLTFNRILFSNTKALLPCFPAGSDIKFKIHYKVKYFEAGKETYRKYFTQEHLDDLFPSRK